MFRLKDPLRPHVFSLGVLAREDKILSPKTCSVILCNLAAILDIANPEILMFLLFGGVGKD